MAGHNKWSKVKHIKAVQDKKKNRIYTKCLKEIMVAARTGSDLSMNARLRTAVNDAKSQSVPKDTIERAIKKGAGELEGEGQIDELTYEGYGPGKVSILVDCVTDNRNRTFPELRKIFEKNDGSLAEPGAVSWNFDTKGLILIKKEIIEEEKLMELALESGAEDIQSSEEGYEIICEPSDFYQLKKSLEEASVAMELSEISRLAKTKTEVSDEDEEKLEKLLEAIEDHDDVQKVFTNTD